MSSFRHYHIYKESAYDDFIKKLDIFHDKSCIGMGMWGYASYGTELEDIPIHLNERLFTKKLSEALIHAFTMIKCDCRVQYQAENGCSIDMLFYDFEGSNYLIQIVRNFPIKSKFTFEVFKLEPDLRLSHINIFWDL